jgi:hypothetical protein
MQIQGNKKLEVATLISQKGGVKLRGIKMLKKSHFRLKAFPWCSSIPPWLFCSASLAVWRHSISGRRGVSQTHACRRLDVFRSKLNGMTFLQRDAKGQQTQDFNILSPQENANQIHKATSLLWQKGQQVTSVAWGQVEFSGVLVGM